MTLPRLILVDTIGATAPEFICAALSRRPDTIALPGLSPIRDRTVLYRGHDLSGLDADSAFDRLWTPSFEPSGRMWAGVLRDTPPDRRAAFDLTAMRARFAQLWRPGDAYRDALSAFVAAVAPSVGAHKPEARVAALAGAPFLRILGDDARADGVRVLDSKVTLPIWLALASARAVVNCADALHYWILSRLGVARAQQQGVAICAVDAVRVGRESALDAEILGFLGLDPDAAPGPVGPWHRAFDPVLFGQTEALAEEIEAIFHGDPVYAAAAAIDDWSTAALRAPEVCDLLERYRDYWRASAHVHFDTCGPLEKAITAAALAAVGLDAERDRRDFGDRLAQAFYAKWIRFRSYSFERPAIDLDMPLGSLEALIPLPQAGYFALAAVAYLERCVESQSKWFDSFAPVAQSDLYRRLTAPDYAGVIARHGLGDRLAALTRKDAQTAERARGKFEAPAKGEDRGSAR